MEAFMYVVKEDRTKPQIEINPPIYRIFKNESKKIQLSNKIHIFEADFDPIYNNYKYNKA